MRRALPFVLAIACTKAVPPPAPDAAIAEAADAAPSVTAITTVAVIDASVPAAPQKAGGSFGTAKTANRVGCAPIAGKHISEKDLKTSYVDGDDLLALVNRSPQGQLPPDYAPSDMVDIRNGKPATASDCE